MDGLLRFKLFSQNPAVDLSWIVDLSLAELRRRLQAGSVPPDAVLHAYMERVRIPQISSHDYDL